MGLDTSFSEIIGISRIWHYKRGLFSSYFLVALIIYFLYEEIEIEKNKIYFVLFIYILLSLIIWILWKITTNRLIIRNGYDLILGIILEVENNPENKDIVFVYNNIKKYSKSIIKGMNVKIIYYPINAISHEKMETFIKSQRSQIDGFLRFSALCGNENNDYKIQISKIRLYSIIPITFKLYDRNFDLRNQIEIQSLSREMKIVKSTSFDDKKNLIEHLESIINHYIGIWFVIKNEHEKALIFLEKNLDKIDFSLDKVRSKINKKEKSIFSDFNTVDLVCRLYMLTSDKYIYNNPEQALNIISKFENLKIESQFSPEFYTRLARLNYDCGNLEKAIFYTDKIALISTEYGVIYFNRVFFGILKEDFKMITSNLRQIFHKRNKFHFDVGIIDFLEKEKIKYPDKELLLNIVINFYQALFTDKNLGKLALNSLINNIEVTNETKDLRYLVNKIINLK